MGSSALGPQMRYARVTGDSPLIRKLDAGHILCLLEAAQRRLCDATKIKRLSY